MKLINHNVGVLSNVELIKVLTERGASKGTGRALASEKMAYHYLCTQPTKHLDGKELEAFYNALQGYDLTKGELMQIANLAPLTAVEVHLIIEKCDERLGESGVEYVIETVQKLLYQAPPEEEAPQAAAAAEDGDDAGQEMQ